MRFSKALKTGHSRDIKWLWPVVLIVVLFFFWHRNPLEPTSDMTAPRDYIVRVLLFNNIKHCRVKTPSGFTLTAADGSIVKFDDSEFIITSSKYGFKIGDGVFAGGKITIKPASPYAFTINKMTFRGNLVLCREKDTTVFDAVNYVPMEPYIASVVGSEVPRYWNLEALKAQAIASRTYCFYCKKKRSRKLYDVKRTESSQVYKGIASEYKSCKNATAQTRGMVMYDGNDIFPAYFCASCGGHTEDANKVFGKDFNTLKAKPCPYCVEVAKKSVFFWKPVRFSTRTITKRLAAKYRSIKPLGLIKKISPRRKSNYGQFCRWTNITLTGKNNKTITLRGEDFRLTVDPTGRKIKSTIFKLTKDRKGWLFSHGRGFGHGVGLCQCGSAAMARKGYSYMQILNYYYNNPKVVKLYD